MAQTKIQYFVTEKGTCSLFDWLDSQPEKVRFKCIARVEALAELGHELREPEVKSFRNGVYGLQIRTNSLSHYVLYMFHGDTALILHALTSKYPIPDKEIGLAIKRMQQFLNNPNRHTFREHQR
ncbi:MAG: hypothetical protein CMJ19_13945 [Phycisphaeraceae bacterium]|nr:hypothetical protein [Phycisphaeraceae bacterium]|tara:strand:+ start:545 stop:916 length:372 start_codon:yes stop_codon:yes gene_type:complete